MISEQSIGDSLEEFDCSFDNSNVAIVQTIEEEKYVVGSNQELDLQIEQMIEKEERMWKCKVCGKTSNHKGMMKQHAEKHIEGVSHTCNLCSKTFSTRHSLQTHTSKHHKMNVNI